METPIAYQPILEKFYDAEGECIGQETACWFLCIDCATRGGSYEQLEYTGLLLHSWELTADDVCDCCHRPLLDMREVRSVGDILEVLEEMTDPRAGDNTSTKLLSRTVAFRTCVEGDIRHLLK